MTIINRKWACALIASCCLLGSQINNAMQYHSTMGAELSCPDSTHLVTIPAHWDQSGRMVNSQYLCVPLAYYSHSSCCHYKKHCCAYRDRVNALKDGVSMTTAYKQ